MYPDMNSPHAPPPPPCSVASLSASERRQARTTPTGRFIYPVWAGRSSSSSGTPIASRRDEEGKPTSSYAPAYRIVAAVVLLTLDPPPWHLLAPSAHARARPPQPHTTAARCSLARSLPRPRFNSNSERPPPPPPVKRDSPSLQPPNTRRPLRGRRTPSDPLTEEDVVAAAA